MSWKICVVLGILMGPLAACNRARCEWPHEADAAVDLTNATVGRPRLTESWFCCAEPTELQRSVAVTLGSGVEVCE